MSAAGKTIRCRLVGGPFDGLDREEPGLTRMIALNALGAVRVPGNRSEQWAVYYRIEPDSRTRDDCIEFYFEDLRDTLP